MRNYVLALAITSAFATPTLAGESRIEARGGIFFANGVSDEAVAGVAAGHDFDLGETGFAGVELSADKILTDGTQVLVGATGRVGIKTGGTRMFFTGGYSSKACKMCEESITAGAGVQQNLNERLFSKVEYRHFFNDFGDGNVIAAGLGLRF